MSAVLFQFIPPSPLPCVSKYPFSTSVSLFLPCKQVHLYHFLRFHIYIYIYKDTIFVFLYPFDSEKAMAPHSSTLAWKIPWTEEPGRLQSMGLLRARHDWATYLSLFFFFFFLPFTFHFHALEKEMATHSSVLAWRIPGTGEPGGLPSMGLHRVGHDWSDLAAAAFWLDFNSLNNLNYLSLSLKTRGWDFCLEMGVEGEIPLETASGLLTIHSSGFRNLR